MSHFSQNAHQLLQAFEQSASQESLARLPRVLTNRCFGETHFKTALEARQAQVASTRFKLALQEENISGSMVSSANRVSSSCLFYMRPLPDYGPESYAVQSDQMMMRHNSFLRLSRSFPIIYADLDRLQDKIMHRGAPVLDYEGSDFERFQTLGLLMAHRMGALVDAAPCGYVPTFLPIKSGVLVATAHRANPDHYAFDAHSVVAQRDDQRSRLSLDVVPAVMTMPQVEIVIRGFQPMLAIPETAPLRSVVRDLQALTDENKYADAAVMSVMDYITGDHVADEMTRHHIPLALNLRPDIPKGDEAVRLVSDMRARQQEMYAALDGILYGYNWELASQAAMEILQQKHILHWGAVCPSPSVTQPAAAPDGLGASHREASTNVVPPPSL